MVLLSVYFTFLISCVSAPPAPVRETATARTAEQAYSTGDYARAANLWQQEAMSATASVAGGLRVSAANSWLMAGRPDLAEDNLRWVEKTDLSLSDQARLNLVLADLSLRADRPDEAELLLQLALPDLPESARSRYDQLLGNTRQMLSRPDSKDLSRVVAKAAETTFYQPQQALQLLKSMENVRSGQLALHAENPRGDQKVTGWLDLALIIRQNLVQPEQVPQAVSDWKGRHPFHFMTERDALDLWIRYRQEFSPPRKIAVLLPDSGRLLAASEAIRDGMMSAYLNQPGGAELFFVSSGTEPESAASAYFEARDMGADWIIGPLQKASIESLLSLADLSTPILALNNLPEDYMAPPGLNGQLYGLSLSQDEETHALARKIIQSGFQRAVILAPESEWGERIVQEFSDEFLREDRQIVASARYIESENDHSPVLERLLKIDESKARKKRLENTLQVKLEFEPVRRDDVDVIFLAANTTQGRLLRPQLRFHDAGDIPVFATGRIFTGRADRSRDQDLNGVRFPITPFQLEAISTSTEPDLASLRGGSFTSLHALGRDAWNVLPWLELMKKDREFRFEGSSGTYRAGAFGKLTREPGFAVFNRGLPVPLQDQSVVQTAH
jgi:outer membrane PBP1 activator LpoA protein